MENDKMKFVRLNENDISDCAEIYFSAFGTHELIRPFQNTDRYFRKYISDNDKYAYGMKLNDRLVAIMTAILSYIFDFYIDFV
jgi:hypothetical protein